MNRYLSSVPHFRRKIFRRMSNQSFGHLAKIIQESFQNRIQHILRNFCAKNCIDVFFQFRYIWGIGESASGGLSICIPRVGTKVSRRNVFEF